MINDDEIKKAARFLRQGKLVAFPTETVYGLGGNALSGEAVASIYTAKGRPQFNPLIVHVRSPEDVEEHAIVNAKAEKLAQRFWPGPLTMVLLRRPSCALSLLVSAGLDTVAFRVPAHSMARALLEEAALPLAAPSANRSGRISPTSASHVMEELGDCVSMVLDGGDCALGIESTVIDVSGKIPVLLRPGSITVGQLAEAVGEISYPKKDSVIASPGMLERHYAPSHSLRLDARDVRKGEILLAFGNPIPGAAITHNLSEKRDLSEAAANLFRMLRALDACEATAIAVMPIPLEGLGVAINDRLKRAAAR